MPRHARGGAEAEAPPSAPRSLLLLRLIPCALHLAGGGRGGGAPQRAAITHAAAPHPLCAPSRAAAPARASREAAGPGRCGAGVVGEEGLMCRSTPPIASHPRGHRRLACQSAAGEHDRGCWSSPWRRAAWRQRSTCLLGPPRALHVPAAALQRCSGAGAESLAGAGTRSGCGCGCRRGRSAAAAQAPLHLLLIGLGVPPPPPGQQGGGPTLTEVSYTGAGTDIP